jgi:hypothetical protein
VAERFSTMGETLGSFSHPSTTIKKKKERLMGKAVSRLIKHVLSSFLVLFIVNNTKKTKKETMYY